MERAPLEPIAEPNVRERSMERAQALAAVKFMGLTAPAEIYEPAPSLLARFRSLLFRA